MIDLLNNKVAEHTKLCARCLQLPADQMLCSGMRPKIVPVAGYHRLDWDECEKISKDSNLYSRMKGAHIPPKAAISILAEPSPPKATMTTQAIKYLKKTYPLDNFPKQSVDVAALRNYLKLLVGLVNSGHTGVFVFPSELCKGSKDVQNEVITMLDLVDFAIIYAPEIYIPNSTVFANLQEAIHYRTYSANLATWFLTPSINSFNKVLSSPHHELHGVVNHINELPGEAVC